ncbi:hypothetical protein Q9L58_007029 [Maublancomyces gigas]|uniref:Uncharacterized protein n=1 Tax=Discina gigas TaxID=1032678 RepID=A0ABR3GDW0_9PEZI
MTSKTPPSEANTPKSSKTTKRIKSVAKFLINPATEFKRQRAKKFDKRVETEEATSARLQGRGVLGADQLGPLVDLEPREARDLFSPGK